MVGVQLFRQCTNLVNLYQNAQKMIARGGIHQTSAAWSGLFIKEFKKSLVMGNMI
jgi:hypothetical protein